MIRFVLIDESDGATTTSGESLTPDSLQLMSDALNQYIALYSTACGGSGSCRVGSSPSDIQPGETAFVMFGDLKNVPGAIAYHDTDGHGVPVAYDAVSLSNSLFGAGNSWSVAVSHEVAETLGNPGCNLWADCLNGKQVARERCDAVEQQTFPIEVGGQTVYVSNFLLDSFFTPNGVAPYDFLSSVRPNPDAPTAPFTTASADGGNYQIVENSGSNESQITAMTEQELLKAGRMLLVQLAKRGNKIVRQEGTSWRQEQKNHWSSRASRIVAGKKNVAIIAAPREMVKVLDRSVTAPNNAVIRPADGTGVPYMPVISAPPGHELPPGPRAVTPPSPAYLPNIPAPPGYDYLNKKP